MRRISRNVPSKGEERASGPLPAGPEGAESIDKPPAYATVSGLLEAYRIFTTHNEFAVGSVVMWKPGMCNRSHLRYGEPGVVLRVLDHPVFDKNDKPLAPDFKEPLDISVAFMQEDGDLVELYLDRRRLQPYQKS